MNEFTAYALGREEGWKIVPAQTNRAWMHESMKKAALRCLPLNIANQAGWWVLSPCDFKACWTSRKVEPDSLVVTFPNKEAERHRGAIVSQFGLGILTFNLPWLFKTPRGIGLWARGPTNMPRAEIQALEGLVETDWSPWTFTMNWKVLKPKVDVFFKKDDPICQLVPYPIGLLESLVPKILPIDNDQELKQNFRQAILNREQANLRGDTLEGKFELSYTRGFRPDAVPAPEHRTKLDLKPFPGM